MAKFVTVSQAVDELIVEGSSVALEGFTHLIPSAVGHEIIRQSKQDLTLIRMTPDVIYDQIIGTGLARRLVFSWGGNPGVGSLHRLRDAVENSYPRTVEIDEHSHAGMATRYVAGASGLPFGVLHGYTGTDLMQHTDTVTPITCPFTGTRLAAVAALHPDVAAIHAQQADREGNVLLWGIVGIQQEAVFAARHALVTVEQVVDELDPPAHSLVLPASCVTAVALAPGGTHPSYAQDYTRRDNAFYQQWGGISKDRTRFEAWVDRHIRATGDTAEYHASLENIHA